MSEKKEVTFAYTIGKTDSYNSAFEDNTSPTKLGREDDYPGGWVFPTFDAAAMFAESDNRKGYSVYGLELPNNWDTDVDTDSDLSLKEGNYLLKNDALLKQLPPSMLELYEIKKRMYSLFSVLRWSIVSRGRRLCQRYAFGRVYAIH